MDINLTWQALLSVVDAHNTVPDNSSHFIHKIASLERAEEHDLVVIFDRGDNAVFDALSPEVIAQSKAGYFLASKDVKPGRTILVDDVLGSYTALVNFLEAKMIKSFIRNEAYPYAYVSADAHVHETAIIHPGAVIEHGSYVGAHAVVGAQCFIGSYSYVGTQVFLHPGVKLLKRCRIGDHSIIHSNTVIGSDGFGYQVNKRGLVKIPHIGNVVIGRNVEIGANCSIDRAVFDMTVLDDGVKLDNGVHIAHNVQIGKGTVILAQTGIAGSTRIGNGCQIGGHVAVKDHVVISDGVKIVSKSAIMHSVDKGSTVAGIPAVEFGQWKRIVVSLQKLPDLIKQAASFKEKNQKNNSSFSLFWRRFLNKRR